MNIEIREKNEIYPFNDFFFYTCFYSSMAPVLVAYGIPVPLIFGNVQYYYEIVNELIAVRYELFEPLDFVLEKVGIEMRQFHGRIDLAQKLKEELFENHPVIIFADLFYLPHRPDKYRKEHIAHSILIIGYDDIQESVIAIEHSSINTLDFKKMEIKLSDIIVAHNEYVKRIDDFGFVACSFENKKTYKKVEGKLENYLDRERNSKIRKSIGLNNLRFFLDNMKARRGRVNELEEDIVELRNNIQDILKAVRGERKLLEMKGCKDYEKDNILLEECWIEINNIIQYFAISGRYKEKKLETLILYLQKIIEIEKRKLDCNENR